MKHLIKRAWTKYALVALVTALIVAPAVAVASHGFTDVPDTHLFHNNIQWMKDNGVTLGCNPPANDKYCPSNTVNRGQMAAFMQRLAENKVVDAATAVTAEHATTADSATTADTATSATTADTATSATTAASADALRGSLPGAALFPVNFDLTSTTTVEAEAISVNVPGPGVLMITVEGNVWIDADSAGTGSLVTAADFYLCTTSAATCSQNADVWYADPDNNSAFNATPGVSLSIVVPVASAGTETVYLNMRSRDGYRVFDNGSFAATAIFLPGDGSGVISSSEPAATESIDVQQ